MRDIRQIRIESILGGVADSVYGPTAPDQMAFSLGIDPSIGENSNLSSRPAGDLRPVGVTLSSGTFYSTPLWFVKNIKSPSISYAYDSGGSIYSLGAPSITDLGDLNDGGGASGNGAAYYDNYIYFSRDTTIARYGPLDGTPTFTDDYWATTLGKTPLTNTAYPNLADSLAAHPNHVMHRHSDGVLYIADVVDNQGTIHIIKTKKTTVEGDTDDGSTYNKIQVGYGLYPTAFESYGSILVITFYEGIASAGGRSGSAKVAFWNTISQKVDDITWEEFPDSFISGIRNMNGLLYFISHDAGTNSGAGFRVSEYIGGHSFREKIFIGDGYPPSPGAIVSSAGRLFFGSRALTLSGIVTPCIYMYRTRLNKLSDGLFPLPAYTTFVANGHVTALGLGEQSGIGNTGVGAYPFFGISDGVSVYKLGDLSPTTGVFPCQFFSRIFKIGNSFKITKITIPFDEENTVLNGVQVRLLMDNFATGYTIGTLTNYVGKKAVIRPENAVGEHNFCLRLNWNNITTKIAITLPIIIEYELIDD